MYFSPPFGGEKALYVHDGPGGGLFSFFLLLLACVFFILPPTLPSCLFSFLGTFKSD